MPYSNRAASFSSFEALTGYDDEIEEVARITDSRIELDDSEKQILNEKIKTILKKTNLTIPIKVTYFTPDDKKSGGAYINHIGTVKRIDEYERKIIFTNKKEINIDDIYNIEDISENDITK